jgi:hypothetical protein
MQGALGHLGGAGGELSVQTGAGVCLGGPRCDVRCEGCGTQGPGDMTGMVCVDNRVAGQQRARDVRPDGGEGGECR